MSLIWLVLALSLLTSPMAKVSANVTAEENRGYIFIGDSRTVGMDSACDVGGHANVFVIARTNTGYDYLVSVVDSGVDSIKRAHPEYEIWTIVSNFGVNDLDNLDKYIDYYKSLSDDFVFVSVNPVVGHPYISNSMIHEFNASMREEFSYIDTNMVLNHRGFNAYDGVHYSTETYSLIFSFIALELGLFRG